MKKHLLATLACLLLTFTGVRSAEVIWKDPNPVPAGTNPAVFPVPREDWLARVQGNFDKTQGKKYDLIFDGDSITDGWQTRGKEVWSKNYAPLNAVDFGIGGDKTEHVLWRLSKGQVDGMDPKLIVLMIGTNNLGRDSVDQIVEGIKAIVGDYLKRCPHSHMLLLAIFPRAATPADPLRVKISEINSKISTLGKDNPRITYLDIGAKFLQPDGTLTTEIMPDLLHPSPKGYEIWAQAIAPEIEKYFPPVKAPASATASQPAATNLQK